MILSTVERFQVEKLVITSEGWSASLQDKSSQEFSDLSERLEKEVCILPIEKWKSRQHQETGGGGGGEYGFM